MGINIAIDGPAGAGKSTIARRVAKELSFLYVDTGAMYRAIAYYCIQKGLSGSDGDRIGQQIQEAQVTISHAEGEQMVFLNSENVTSFLRSEEVSHMASVMSAIPQVRRHLLALQQSLAANHNVVMDGRDIGTTILPNAQLKIFLTANPATRAKRRYQELINKGVSCSEEEILKEMTERDERDSGREASPLCQAEDAVLVDTSDLSIDEVTERIIALYREKMKRS